MHEFDHLTNVLSEGGVNLLSGCPQLYNRFETINTLSLAHSGKIPAASLSECIFRLKSAHVVVVTDISRGTKCAPGACVPLTM